MSKWAFICHSIAYLGHRIFEAGVEVDPEKIHAVIY